MKIDLHEIEQRIAPRYLDVPLRRKVTSIIGVEASIGTVPWPSFTLMAKTYIHNGGKPKDIVLLAEVLAPGKIDAWVMVRMLFEVMPPPLDVYATTLGPNNWREAYTACEKHREVWPSLRAKLLAGMIALESLGEDIFNGETIEVNTGTAFCVVYANPSATERIVAMACHAVEGEEVAL
jgi:hypothetical protein